MLQIQPNSDNSAGHFSFPGKFRLLVKGKLWTNWSQAPSTIPLYILDALAHPTKSRANQGPTIDEMELTEETFRPGDNIVGDEIETDGPEMLITKYGESEIAFGVTGRDIKCAGHKLSMIGWPYDHGQYIGWIPKGLLEEQILNRKVFDGYGEQYQTRTRVLFREPLEKPAACSWMVYTRELERGDPQILSCVRVPAQIGETQKLPAHQILQGTAV